jgi:hypothetical protein
LQVWLPHKIEKEKEKNIVNFEQSFFFGESSQTGDFKK